MIFIIVKRSILFIFLICLTTLSLYFIGAFQQFTDAALTMLLQIAGFSGLLLGIYGAFGIIMEFWFLFKKENYRIVLNIVLFFILGIFGLLVAVFAFFIQALMGGYAT